MGLVVDVRDGAPPREPDASWPVLAVHAGTPPRFATFSISEDELPDALAAVLLLLVREGAARAAERAERATVADLVELVCHDARNPLAAISANLGMLEAADLDTNSQEAIADSMIAADGALQIIENLARTAALESGRAKDVRGTTDARAAVDDAIRRFRRASQAAQIPFVVEVPDRSVPCACAPQTLGAMLDNLLSVALRYAPRGSDVRLKVEPREGTVAITVSEAGAPVPPELASTIFERASQRATSRSAKGRYGRGLGLYVSRLLAEACGARLESVAVGERNAYRLVIPVDIQSD